MGSTQGITLSQDGGNKSNATSIDLLQSRFTALSKITSANPKRNLPHSICTPITPIRPGNEKTGVRYDHHTPPYEDLDFVRKRQKRPQETRELSLGVSSESHMLDSLAPAIINSQIGTLLSSTPVVSVAEATTALPIKKAVCGTRGRKTTQGKKKHSAARQFLGHSDESSAGQVSGGDEEKLVKSGPAEKHLVEHVEVDAGQKIKNRKVEDMNGEGISISESEVGESQETQTQTDLTSMEPVVEKLETLKVEGVFLQTPHNIPAVQFIAPRVENERPALRLESREKIPEAVLTRYPKMAKYLTIKENSTKQTISVPSMVHEEITTTRLSGLLQKNIEGASIEKVYVVGCIGNARLGDGKEAPSPVTPKGGRRAARAQGSTDSRAVATNKVEDATVLENKLEDTPRLPGQDQQKSVQSVSSRPRLPERYAIPVTAQKSGPVARLGVGRAIGGTQLPTEKDPLMEQLALIDGRFSKESEGSFVSLGPPEGEIHGPSSSQKSSIPTKPNVTLSSKPNLSGFTKTAFTAEVEVLQGVDTPIRTSKQLYESFGDPERFRRSRGPSPSPHTGRGTDVSIVKFEQEFATDSPMHNRHGKHTERTNAAGNWLGQFNNSGIPASPPRGQSSAPSRTRQAPSPVNRATGAIVLGPGNENDDSDGVAPGEWVLPVGVSREPLVKQNIGITAEPPPLLFQPGSAPMVRSTTGSVTGSVMRGQWTKVLPTVTGHSTIVLPESGSSTNNDMPGVIQPRTVFAKENPDRGKAEAEAKERVIREWCERGFIEVGRMDATGPEKQRKVSNTGAFPDNLYGSNVNSSENLRVKGRVPREGGLFASPPRIYPSSSEVQHLVVARPGYYPIQARNRKALDRSPSPTPTRPLVRQGQQHQPPVDPNVQELANILKSMQTTQGEKQKDFLALQAPKTNQNPLSAQAFTIHQTCAIPQTSMARQEPRAPLVASPSENITQPVPESMPKPKIPRKLDDYEHPILPGYVRKLCPVFFFGRCTRGLSCSDLHPNYDEQSGTFVDNRFATEEEIEEEILTRDEKEIERGKALEALIKKSREDADRKCYDSKSNADRKPKNLRVAAAVVVGKNAKGEKDWLITHPPMPPKPVNPPENGGSSTAKPMKQHR